MTQNLDGMGFTVVPFGQGFKDMSPPTKKLMKLTLEQKIAHGGHPVFRWMMDNIFVRTDPAGNIKAELVLNELGIPMSNAINIFLRQVVLQKGLPFDVKIATNKPLIYNEMTVEQFNDAMEKGMADLENERVVSTQSVKQRLHQEYGV